MRMGGDTTHKKTQDLCKKAKTKKRFLFSLCHVRRERGVGESRERITIRLPRKHEQSTDTARAIKG